MVTSHQTTESTDDYDESRTGWNEVAEASVLVRIGSPTMPEWLHLPTEAKPPDNAGFLWTSVFLLGALHLLGHLVLLRGRSAGAIASLHSVRSGHSLECAVKIGCL